MGWHSWETLLVTQNAPHQHGRSSCHLTVPGRAGTCGISICPMFGLDFPLQVRRSLTLLPLLRIRDPFSPLLSLRFSRMRVIGSCLRYYKALRVVETAVGQSTSDEHARRNVGWIVMACDYRRGLNASAAGDGGRKVATSANDRSDPAVYSAAHENDAMAQDGGCAARQRPSRIARPVELGSLLVSRALGRGKRTEAVSRRVHREVKRQDRRPRQIHGGKGSPRYPIQLARKSVREQSAACPCRTPNPALEVGAGRVA